MIDGPGILAVFNDCAPGEEAGYEAWYHGEHLVERLSVPGFRWGRRYRALDGVPEYLTYYEVDNPGVLTSPAYLERLNNPTEETRRIMSGVFRNMSRTVCHRTDRRGAIRGAFCVVARFSGEVPGLPPAALWHERWVSVEAPVHAVSTEEALRGGDAKIGGALLVDISDEMSARALMADWIVRWPGAEVGAYALISTLAHGDLA